MIIRDVNGFIVQPTKGLIKKLMITHCNCHMGAWGKTSKSCEPKGNIMVFQRGIRGKNLIWWRIK